MVLIYSRMQSEGYFTKYYTPHRVGGVEPWSAGTLKGSCIAVGLRLACGWLVVGLRLACAGLAVGLRRLAVEMGLDKDPPENIA